MQQQLTKKSKHLPSSVILSAKILLLIGIIKAVAHIEIKLKVAGYIFNWQKDMNEIAKLVNR